MEGEDLVKESYINANYISVIFLFKVNSVLLANKRVL
jgi:hypothetical protein